MKTRSGENEGGGIAEERGDLAGRTINAALFTVSLGSQEAGPHAYLIVFRPRYHAGALPNFLRKI